MTSLRFLGRLDSVRGWLFAFDISGGVAKWITCYFSTQGTGLLGSFNFVEGIALLCAVAAAALRAATSKKELMGAGVVEKSFGSTRRV